jgi:hypothetical protein
MGRELLERRRADELSLWIASDGTPMLYGSPIHPLTYLALKAQGDVCFWERFGEQAPKDYRVFLDKVIGERKATTP